MVSAFVALEKVNAALEKLRCKRQDKKDKKHMKMIVAPGLTAIAAFGGKQPTDDAAEGINRMINSSSIGDGKSGSDEDEEMPAGKCEEWSQDQVVNTSSGE